MSEHREPPPHRPPPALSTEQREQRRAAERFAEKLKRSGGRVVPAPKGPAFLED
jgi:hypothetical protein